MKRAKIIPSNFPYDCWSCVIRYMSSSKGFFCLVSTVKGLFEYVKNVNPRCMTNVEFKILRIPYSSKTFVTNICCDMNSMMLGNSIRGCGDFETLLGRLCSKFPNLEKLDIGASYGEIFESRQRRKVFSNIVFQTDFCHLRHLEIRLPDVENFQLLSKLPKLEVLILKNRVRDEIEDLFLPSEPNLSIFWPNLPLLKNVNLTGWCLSTPLMNKSFDSLTLSFTQTVEKVINESFSIQELTIEDETLGYITSIERVASLKKLILSDYGFIGLCYEISEEDCDILSRFQIVKDLPLLEYIEFDCTARRWYMEDGIEAFVLESLPNLRKVIGNCTKFNVVLSNTPKIEVISFDDYDCWVEIKVESDMSHLKKLCMCGDDWTEEHFPIGPNICKNLSNSNYVENLEILKVSAYNYSSAKLWISDFPKLKEIESSIGVMEIKQCPVLEKAKVFNSRNFVVGEGVEELKEIDIILEQSEDNGTTADPHVFFENLHGKEIETVKVGLLFSPHQYFYDCHLQPAMISGICVLDLSNLNELIIICDEEEKGSCRLSSLILNKVKHVEIVNLSSLLKCNIRNLGGVAVFKKCESLEIVKIANQPIYQREVNEFAIQKLVFENLPSIKMIDIISESSIKSVVTSGLPGNLVCSTSTTTKVDGEEACKKIHLASTRIMYRKK